MAVETSGFLLTGNGRTVPRTELPRLGFPAFSKGILEGTGRGLRVAAFFGTASERPGTVDLVAVLADDDQSALAVAVTEVEGPAFPSLTPECPQVHLFEREIAEQYGLVPEGHPELAPVRHRPSRDFVPAVEGDQVHEVSVGPVHAGIIEPGHFRFRCRGERVLALEIALGFQHRGVEEALVRENSRILHWTETVAGDTTIGHALTCCQAWESLAGTRVPARAQALRGIALELERLANHVGDLGALAGDVGFLPTASYNGRIRGDLLNLTGLLSGSRFGRGFVQPGGVGFDVDERMCGEVLAKLRVAEKEAAEAVELLWENQSVMARFEGTGALSSAQVRTWGLVGPAARASGVSRDVRFHQPSGIFRMAQVPVSTCDSGDVFGRAYVRWLEILQSMTFIRDQFETLPAGQPFQSASPLAPGSFTAALNEGWRGEICHALLTKPDGRLDRYKIVDPSFHNWKGLAVAMKNQEISDFPLCNKSFNLSYCGHDL